MLGRLGIVAAWAFDTKSNCILTLVLDYSNIWRLFHLKQDYAMNEIHGLGEIYLRGMMFRLLAEIYTYRVLQTIQMKLILLCLGRAGRFGQH